MTDSQTKPVSSDSSAGTSILLELVLPALVGVVATIAWVLILSQIGESRFKTMFHGPIQHICVFLLVWHVCIVLVRWMTVVRREAQALRFGFLPQDQGQLSLEGVLSGSQKATKYEAEHGPTMITRRIILAATNLSVRGDEETLSQMMHRRAETDRQRAEDAYAVPNFIFWAIPILGFIGTVVGIGVAIAGLEGADVATATLLRDKIGGIAGALGQAFDTTQVALMFSVAALLVQTLVNRIENRLHDDLEDHLIYRLESRLAPTPSDQEQIVAALQTLDATIIEDSKRREVGQQQYLQQVARAHETLSETMHQIPGTVREAGKEVAQLQDQWQQSIGVVATQISNGLEEQLQNIAQRLVQTMAEERQSAAQAVESSFARAQQQQMDNVAAASQPLLTAIQEILDGQKQLLGQTHVMRKLEESVVNTVENLRQAGEFDQTLQDLTAVMTQLKPVLAKLRDPVPVKLSLAGVEASLGDGA